MLRRDEQFVKGLSRAALWAGLFLVIIWLSLSWSRENRDAVRISLEESTQSVDATGTKKPRVKVIVDSLNLRSEPGADGRQVVGTLKKGEVVEILSKKLGWLQVELDDGRTGYVTDSPQYISAVDE